MSDVRNLEAVDHELPFGDRFNISGSKLDRDRIELQFSFDGADAKKYKSFSYDVDFLLFVPRTWGLSSGGFEQFINQDVTSYLRLHTETSNPNNSRLAFERITKRLETLASDLTPMTIRFFGNDLYSFLKAENNRMLKHLRNIQRGKGNRDKKLDKIIGRCLMDLNLLKRFREFLYDNHINLLQEDQLGPDRNKRDLYLLNMYISHYFVQFIGEVLHTARETPECLPLTKFLEQTLLDESHVRKDFGLYLNQATPENGTNSDERYLHKISLLKKFFQKNLFIKATFEEAEGKILYPVYALAAAAAASWAIAIQYWIFKNTDMSNVTGGHAIPTAIIVTGVLAYIVKDILKDYLRRFFLRTGTRWLPLRKKKLVLKRGQKQFKIGSIEEYSRLIKSRSLPKNLRDARYGYDLGYLERNVSEDVLHFKKRVKLVPEQLSGVDDFPWGLREIMRISFSRMQITSDEAYQETYFLNEKGQIEQKSAHRVYEIYLVAWIRKTEKRSLIPSWRSANDEDEEDKIGFKAFRLKMDKEKILAVETVRWKKDFGIPTVPGLR